MAKTRSASSLGVRPKKIKFLDDGEFPSDVEVIDLDTRESTVEPQAHQESELDSDSDDAPEEESISTSKQASVQKQKEQQKLEQELRKQEKEKRKQKDLQYQKQQQEKRDRIKELTSATELPDLLPDDVLESDDEDEIIVAGKHMRAEDLEKEHLEMRKKMKLEKLRQLKEQRTQAVKRGPVLVKVQSFNPNKKQVPRAEQSVLDSKSSWLMRASLGKK